MICKKIQITNIQLIFNQKLLLSTTTSNLRIISNFDNNANITSNNKIINYNALLIIQNAKNAHLKIKQKFKIAQRKKQKLKKLINEKNDENYKFSLLCNDLHNSIKNNRR